MLTERVVLYKTADGHEWDLIQVRDDAKPPTKGPVLLVPGAGVRANLFRPPVEKNFVEYLVEHGYDVWLENWRASIGMGTPPENNPPVWSLDQAAAFDHPAAVKKVVEETGCRRMKAVIHCQGSTSFIMSAIAGLVPQVTTIVSNAVSLHPVVPRKTYYKSKASLDFVSCFTTYLDSRWGYDPDAMPKHGKARVLAKLLVALLRVSHFECLNPVCKMASFSYGIGIPRPVLWLHENLGYETHEWIKDEFGKVPMTFFKQMDRCFTKGHLVKFETDPKYRMLPDDFTAQPPQTDARFAFFAGELNSCFLPLSQKKSYDYFSHHRRNYHSLNILRGYGHLDVFIGKNSAKDVFPLMVQELEH